MSDFHNFSAQKRGIYHPYDTLAVKQQGHHDFKLKTIGFWGASFFPHSIYSIQYSFFGLKESMLLSFR